MSSPVSKPALDKPFLIASYSDNEKDVFNEDSEFFQFLLSKANQLNANGFQLYENRLRYEMQLLRDEFKKSKDIPFLFEVEHKFNLENKMNEYLIDLESYQDGLTSQRDRFDSIDLLLDEPTTSSKKDASDKFSAKKIVLGSLIDTTLTPLVVLRKGTTAIGEIIGDIVKPVFEIIQVGAVSEGCLSTSSDAREYQRCVKEQLDVIKGNNPEVNRAILDSTPQWLKSTSQGIERVVTEVQKFDAYMHENFGTEAGRVTSAAGGLFDVGSVVLLTGAIRAVKFAFKASPTIKKPTISLKQTPKVTSSTTQTSSSLNSLETSAPSIPTSKNVVSLVEYKKKKIRPGNNVVSLKEFKKTKSIPTKVEAKTRLSTISKIDTTAKPILSKDITVLPSSSSANVVSLETYKTKPFVKKVRSSSPKNTTPSNVTSPNNIVSLEEFKTIRKTSGIISRPPSISSTKQTLVKELPKNFEERVKLYSENPLSLYPEDSFSELVRGNIHNASPSNVLRTSKKTMLSKEHLLLEHLATTKPLKVFPEGFSKDIRSLSKEIKTFKTDINAGLVKMSISYAQNGKDILFLLPSNGFQTVSQWKTFLLSVDNMAKMVASERMYFIYNADNTPFALLLNTKGYSISGLGALTQSFKKGSQANLALIEVSGKQHIVKSSLENAFPKFNVVESKLHGYKSLESKYLPSSKQSTKFTLLAKEEALVIKKMDPRFTFMSKQFFTSKSDFNRRCRLMPLVSKNGKGLVPYELLRNHLFVSIKTMTKDKRLIQLSGLKPDVKGIVRLNKFPLTELLDECESLARNLKKNKLLIHWDIKVHPVALDRFKNLPQGVIRIAEVNERDFLMEIDLSKIIKK